MRFSSTLIHGEGFKSYHTYFISIYKEFLMVCRISYSGTHMCEEFLLVCRCSYSGHVCIVLTGPKNPILIVVVLRIK